MGTAQIIIFALLVNVVYANNSFTENKPSLHCNLPSGYVDESLQRGFVGMKLIPLSSSKRCKNFGKYFAQVDDDMYPFLIHWNWNVVIKTNGLKYASRSARIDGRVFKIYMHRFIMGVTETTIEVDHRNWDGLCNLVENIRCGTVAQNQWNSRKRKNASSKYKGVSWNTRKPPRKSRWRVSISIGDYKELRLGGFDDEIEAAKCYDESARKYHGEFAVLNFPENKPL